MLAPALAERLTLLLNHVLASEAVATERLLPHRGATLQLTLERCRYYVAYKERLVAGSHNSRAPQMHTEL